MGSCHSLIYSDADAQLFYVWATYKHLLIGFWRQWDVGIKGTQTLVIKVYKPKATLHVMHFDSKKQIILFHSMDNVGCSPQWGTAVYALFLICIRTWIVVLGNYN